MNNLNHGHHPALGLAIGFAVVIGFTVLVMTFLAYPIVCGVALAGALVLVFGGRVKAPRDGLPVSTDSGARSNDWNDAMQA